MSRVITNPPGLHDPTGYGYSHAVSAPPGELVFIAGQYGSDADGEVVSTDFTAQAQRAVVNLGIALEAVGLDVSHVVRIGTYIVDHDVEKLHLVADLVQQTWGHRPPAQTLTGVASLALPDMLFEIDAVAVRPEPAARRATQAPDVAQRDSTGRAATLVRAGEAEVLDGDPNGTITLLADHDATGRRLTSNRSTFRNGADGAPPHYHANSAELFFVISGALEVLIGEQVSTLRTGDFLVVAPGTPHAFAAAPGADADVLFVFTPGTARFDYYRLLDRAHRGEASWDEIADSQDRFDNHYVESSAWREARAAGPAA